ncbi:MAG TPA: transposase, partial [Thermoanaerobaculia bacterium]|nr:transposase [Thermoanaerobaculia bacterium]
LNTPELRKHVHAYLAGIARNLGCEPYTIGGHDDHAHGLLRLKATIAVADVLEKLKANSSKWIKETYPDLARFAWQRGYGAFSVSYSNLTAVRRYIERQEEHHRKTTFKEELEALLARHDLVMQDEDLSR